MSPSPVTFALPTAPASYAWEATDEAVAERYAVALERIRRFDLNTSPAPPPVAARVLAAGGFEPPLSEYPPGDYGRLAAVAAGVYGVAADELLVGAGADEVLDICARALLPPGDAAVVPAPTYAMYRVLTDQRPARIVTVPRLGPEGGFGLDVAAVQAAARDAALVWLCDPNNPTGGLEPDGAIEALLEAIAADARDAGRAPAAVVLDEAYAEFSGRSRIGLRDRYPNLVLVRTISKAYALAGLRVGFAIAARPTIARLAPYRPPGSVTIPSLAVATAALGDEAWMRANVERVSAERERFAAALAGLGWAVRPSATNFLLAGLGSRERAAAAAEALLADGLVPRTFPADHPLADSLRLTVRTREDDDRLVEVARASEAGGR